MFIDAHSHIGRYDLVDEQALGSALAEINQGGTLTVSNAMDLPSYKRNLEISEMGNLVLPTFGVHPWNAPRYADRLEDLSGAIEASPTLDEIGLDHYFVKGTSTYPAQGSIDRDRQPWWAKCIHRRAWHANAGAGCRSRSGRGKKNNG
jgi:TatD DNase family protein